MTGGGASARESGAGAAPLPACPLCLETLGAYGGPATLPCGHNGCVDCLAALKTARRPQCPLCRAPFDSSREIVCNTELRDLITLATCLYMDAEEKAAGWEAFPDGKMVVDDLAHDLKETGAGPSGSGAGPHHHHGHEAGASGSGTAPLTMMGALGPPPDRDLLALEPPQWLPDSFATQCSNCHLPFRAITRLRHHCRMCGKIFCGTCTSKRMLLPPKYMSRQPQRVCELCSTLLAPLQPFLAGTQAHAVQPPVHDAADSVSLRSWLNLPWAGSLESDVFKCANILQTFTRSARLHPERALPSTVLRGARGLAVLSVVKVGAGWSCTFGTGLVVSRSPEDGTWSAPCAVMCCGVGWGLQLGGELTDLLLVLRTEEAVRACCSGMQLGVGGNASAAVGPVGRHADASVVLDPGSLGASTVLSYSYTRGAFVGVSLEGTLMVVRDQVNQNFYGYPATARQLLLERAVPQPPAASLLYDALHSLGYKYDAALSFTGPVSVPMTSRPSTSHEAAAAATQAAGSSSTTAAVAAAAAAMVGSLGAASLTSEQSATAAGSGQGLPPSLHGPAAAHGTAVGAEGAAHASPCPRSAPSGHHHYQQSQLRHHLHDLHSQPQQQQQSAVGSVAGLGHGPLVVLDDEDDPSTWDLPSAPPHPAGGAHYPAVPTFHRPTGAAAAGAAAAAAAAPAPRVGPSPQQQQQQQRQEVPSRWDDSDEEDTAYMAALFE